MPRDDEVDRKVQVLKEQGVLNPKPDRVRDERFRTNEFFDPRDLVQVKYEMVRQVREEGMTVTETAERFGQSRPTFYAAQRALDEGGLGGLLPKRPGPKRPHKLTEDVMAAVEERRQEQPGVRSEALAQFIDERFGIQVHPRSVERALVRREKKRRERRGRRDAGGGLEGVV